MVIYSAETRQIKVEYKGQELLIRQAEDDNSGENIVFLNERWINSYNLKDEELKQIVDTICDNIREDIFDKKGEIDLTDYFNI
jgi:hypothetical protein